MKIDGLFLFSLLLFIFIIIPGTDIILLHNHFHRVFHCRFIKINDCAHKYYCVFALILSQVSCVRSPSVDLNLALSNTVRTKYYLLRVLHHLTTLHGAVIILRSNHLHPKMNRKKSHIVPSIVSYFNEIVLNPHYYVRENNFRKLLLNSIRHCSS